VITGIIKNGRATVNVIFRLPEQPKLYLPINLVRVDKRTGNVFILAGEENMIEIYPNGKWRYVV